MNDSKVGFPIISGWAKLWEQCGYNDWRTLHSGWVMDALEFASKAHAGQTRKDGTPYILHPIRVFMFIQTTFKVTDLVTGIGALCHDSVEDVSWGLQQSQRDRIKSQFGDPVALLVDELTNDETLPSEEKKTKMIENARSFSNRARIIKAADRIDNLLDMVRVGDKRWLSKYVPESQRLLVSLRDTATTDRNIELSKAVNVACDYLESVIIIAETI